MSDQEKKISLSHRVALAGEGSSRGVYAGIASTLGLPVDLINAGLKAVGVKTSEEPVLGSAHINKYVQKGLDYYYNKVAPALGAPPQRMEDDLDKDIYVGTYIAGNVAGFGGAASASYKVSKTVGSAIAGGTTVMMADDVATFVKDKLKQSRDDIVNKREEASTAAPASKPAGPRIKLEDVKL